MVKVKVEQMPEEVYFDGGLYRNLLQSREGVLKHDFDCLIYLCGRERNGKSTLAMQMACALDPSFNIDKVCWTPEQFEKLINEGKKGDCIVYDEAHLMFTSQSSIMKVQKKIISKITTIGSKNMFLIVVAPTIFDMSKYLIIHRARSVVRVTAVGFQRGFWHLYTTKSKRLLYLRGKKEYDYDVCRSDIRGRFTRWFPLDKVEYERRKQEAINSMSILDDKVDNTVAFKRAVNRRIGKLLRVLKDKGLVKVGYLQVCAEDLGIPRRTLTDYITKYGGVKGVATLET